MKRADIVMMVMAYLLAGFIIWLMYGHPGLA